MISLQEVNEKYRDVLAEIGNIGAGNATTAVADMLGLRIDMSVFAGGRDRNIDWSRGRGHRWHHAWCWQ